jgi:hypothetical protein
MRNALAALTLAVLVVVAGCAAEPDWRSRIGSYDYYQVVAEIGEPETTSRSVEGGLVLYHWPRGNRDLTMVFDEHKMLSNVFYLRNLPRTRK